MKYTIMTGLVCLGLFAGAIQAQEGDRNEVTVSATGSFEQSTNGNGIHQSAENSAGVLFSYRYFFTDHQGLEVNYGFSRFNQQYSSLNAATPLSLGVPANTNEATASYIYRHAVGHRLTPFVSAGTGALIFVPDSFTSGGVSGSKFATPDFVYSAGADLAVSRRISLRLGYRGHVFEAPDFGVPGIKTGSVAHMAEPFGGISFHF
ncbi:MAG: outer membrane beta-barrel protein [Acidobacteriaceae bacterium]|nr:outer membrane beta-barrel protein [Acidobacteriaceae bacterium]MBV9778600.1 outer membrane beta-barrel protein [Acidobacteriaceae bacterium]